MNQRPDRKVRRRSRGKNILNCLTTGEREQVLQELLRRHPELQAEATAIAAEVLAVVSVADVRADVVDRARNVDLAELSGRAGRQECGYVEPSEAAWELLEEAIADIRDDVKRRKESCNDKSAEMVCRGLILGLYDVRKAEGDGALAWAPDFPAEAAGLAMSEFLALFPSRQRPGVGDKMLADLRDEAGEWAELMERVVRDALK